jgi:hypothetical protein
MLFIASDLWLIEQRSFGWAHSRHSRNVFVRLQLINLLEHTYFTFELNVFLNTKCTIFHVLEHVKEYTDLRNKYASIMPLQRNFVLYRVRQ